MKSRLTWLSSGDKNTKYFNRSVIIKRRKSRITHLIKNDGSCISDQSQIGDEIVNNLSNTLASINPITQPSADILLLSKISENQKVFLTQTPNKTEIKNSMTS